MGLKKYLIDSNVIINYLNGNFNSELLDRLDEIFNNNSAISVINKIELLAYHSLNQSQFDLTSDFVSTFDIYKIDDEIIESTIKIKRGERLKIPDAIIAATALKNDLRIITNDNDFERVANLKLIQPQDI